MGSGGMQLLILLFILLCANVAFGLDERGFKFGGAPFGEGDKQQIKTEKGNGRLVAYAAPGAFVFSLRDGTEYGYDVWQVRMYDSKTKKLYSVYSDDIERLPGESMRGIEARYGEIKYIGKSKVQFEVFWKDKLDGYGVVDLDTVKFAYRKVKP